MNLILFRIGAGLDWTMCLGGMTVTPFSISSTVDTVSFKL